MEHDILHVVREKGLALGTHCSSADLGLYEICGRLGYDYIWIDNEHAGITNPMIFGGIVAAQAGGCASFVRVPANDPVQVKPILEMGPSGVIFPMVNSPEEAERAVRSCWYPPRGNRGFGPLRAMDYGLTPLHDYLAAADRSVLRVIQAEHVDCVRRLDEILEVPGIDLVICGPMDLSASVGKLGQLEDPEVVALMQQTIDKCRAAGVPYGLSIGYDIPLATFFIEQGASFVSMGNPYDFFRLMSKQMLDQLTAVRPV